MDCAGVLFIASGSGRKRSAQAKKVESGWLVEQKFTSGHRPCHEQHSRHESGHRLAGVIVYVVLARFVHQVHERLLVSCVRARACMSLPMLGKCK